MRPFLPVLLCILLVSCATQRMAENPFDFESAPLPGMVYDTESNPVSAVTVIVDGLPGPQSDLYGRFIIPNLTKGTHTLVAMKDGYEPVETTVEFLNKTHVLYIRMNSFASLLIEAERSLADNAWERAEDYLERAAVIGNEPGLSTVWFMFAVLASKRQDHHRAILYLENIIAAGHRLPSVYLFMADIHQFELSDPGTAVDYLLKYLELRGDPRVKERLERLREKTGSVS